MPTLPPSPCVNLCRMDPAGRYCTGCLRTLDEIADWSRLDAAQREAVLAAVAQRRQQTGNMAQR